MQRQFKKRHWKNGLRKCPWVCNACLRRIVKNTRFCRHCSPWGNGRVNTKCEVCGKAFEIYRSQLKKKKTCSSECKGIRTGKRQRGSLSHFYIDGRSPEMRKIRSSGAMARWRNEVFQRDDFTCQRCSVKGGKLHAHHLVLFSELVAAFKIKTFEDALACFFFGCPRTVKRFA